MSHSKLGLLVHRQIQESTETHVHCIGDAIEPSYPLSTPSPPPLTLSQHQDLFKWVSSLHQVAKVGVSASTSVLPINIQHWFPLGWTGLISLQSKWLSRVFSNTALQKHQFFGTQPYLWSNSHLCTWLLEKKHSFDYMDFVSKVMSLLFNVLSRLVMAFLPRSMHF